MSRTGYPILLSPRFILMSPSALCCLGDVVPKEWEQNLLDNLWGTVQNKNTGPLVLKAGENNPLKVLNNTAFSLFLRPLCLDLSFVYFHMCSLGHRDPGGANADPHRHPWTPPCNSIMFKHTHVQPFLPASRLKHFATAGGREVRPGISPSQGSPILQQTGNPLQYSNLCPKTY